MPFPPASILDSLIPGSTVLEPRTPSVEELLGDYLRIFGDMDAETFAEPYHDAFKIDAMVLFQGFADFIEVTLNLAGRSDIEQECLSLKLTKAELESSLEWLNERENGLRTLEAFPTNGMVH